MNQEQHEIICEVKTEDTGDLGSFADQLSRLKEDPLRGTGEGENEEKKDKKAEKAAIGRVSDMIAGGLVQGLKSGDVRGALGGVGLQMAEGMASALVSKGINSILSAIPGLGTITSLLGFQHEGLVRNPTLALVGEHEPEFIVTQERMRGLMQGGRPGYGFGPGDFGVPNVNVAAPNVAVEVNVAPGVDADIQTAYRCRAGEARLSQLEG
ncbi:MAG: hypothetical protein PVH29_11750 [Candidatus Zixiibacteriota bacterium]|jgi:hypothetical protein